MKKIRYIGACLVFFAVGAHVWKIKKAGLANLVESDEKEDKHRFSLSSKDSSVLFEIGNETITQADIDWEYQRILDELELPTGEKQGPKSSPPLSTLETTSLKKKLASSLIERKVLYSFIKKDNTFDLSDPNRYTACLSQWQSIVARQNFGDHGDKIRLKARLCERSVLDQYLEERLFKDIAVREEEITHHYRDHKDKFRQYESVTIKHILFVDEPTAKRWRGALTMQNFSEMARSHSITPEGKTGGRLGPYAKGMLPAVFDIAFQMKIGEISDILRSNYGYHVILLEDKTAKQNLDLARSRSEIIKLLLKQKKEKAYDEWLEQALASIKVAASKTSM